MLKLHYKLLGVFLVTSLLFHYTGLAIAHTEQTREVVYNEGTYILATVARCSDCLKIHSRS